MDKTVLIEDATPVEFDPFGGPEMIRVVPATEPQLEIWVSCLLGAEDANRSYNESVSLRLTGILDQAALESALRDLIQRHEALRSAFSADGKQICIYKDWPLDLVFRDLSQKDTESQQEFIEDFSREDAEIPFDLVKGPLFRISLFRLGEKSHFLKFTAHHIICDGWSLGILLQDLGKLYSAYAKREKPQLTEAIPFSQYAMEYWEFSGSEAYKKIEQYWIDQYRENVPVVDLPTDFLRPALRTYKSCRDDYPLDPLLVAAIKKTGIQAGCSFVTSLFAAFEVFLQRLTGQHDIIVGLPAAGQSVSGHYGLVGHCVHLLPLRSSFSGSSSFTEYLKQRKTKMLDDFENQQFTLGSLLKKLNMTRDPSRIPLVPVVFNVDMGLDDGVAFYGLEYRLLYNPREYENFEIFLNVSGSEQALMMEWSYNTQLFSRDSIRRMMLEFESLLRTIVANKHEKIKDFPHWEEDELKARLKAWNDTFSDYPREKSLQDLIRDVAGQFPSKTAIRFGDKELSYGKLEDYSNRFASVLIHHGVVPGDIVGLATTRSVEMLVSMLAILKAGAAYLPIDPEYPAQRIEFMLQDSGARFLLLNNLTQGYRSGITEMALEKIWASLPDVSGQGSLPLVSGKSLAYLLYTSGSTGMPKAVQVEHRNLVNFLLSMKKRPGINPGDRLLAITTISFDISGLELFLPLVTGAEVVLAPTETARDGRLLLDLLQKEDITMMQATPSTWRMLIESGWDKPLGLKALCGGEALPKDLADKMLIRCDSLWNMYGPTETTIWSAIKQIAEGDEVISIGRPIDNTTIYIMDEYLKPLPEGAIGELYIGGEGVARGYLNRPEMTASRFIPDPISNTEGARIYRTGDLGKLLGTGDIQCLGRIDQQIKLRGHRIELGEIELSLSRLSGISESVVIVREDRLVAYVVPDEQMDCPEKDQADLTVKWKEQLQDVLPSYMVPGDFVLIPRLPLTPNGKIDRNALPKPELPASGGPGSYAAPRTETEHLIADIWASLLGLEKVGIHDDFFELGGHSMIAVQAMSRLEKETGKRLPLASLLEAPTVEKLSRLVSSDPKSVNWNSLVPIKPSGNKMPLYIVHGFGMNVLLFNNVAKNMDPDQPVYALQAKGLNRADETLDKMEDIAAHYVSEILVQNPGDAFALAGYSFGGIIAFEMAKQLKAMGKQIRMLAMFDTYADNSDYLDPWTTKFRKKFMRQFPKMLFVSKSFVRRPGKTITYQVEYVKRVLNERFGIFSNEEEDGYNANDDKIIEKYEYAYRHYKMTAYDGSIDLFKVKTRLYFLDDLEFLGWKPFARQGVDVHEISGDHKTFLMPPHARDFGRILQATLDERTASADRVNKFNKDHVVLKAV